MTSPLSGVRSNQLSYRPAAKNRGPAVYRHSLRVSARRLTPEATPNAGQAGPIEAACAAIRSNRLTARETAG